MLLAVLLGLEVKQVQLVELPEKIGVVGKAGREQERFHWSDLQKVGSLLVATWVQHFEAVINFEIEKVVTRCLGQVKVHLEASSIEWGH